MSKQHKHERDAEYWQREVDRAIDYYEQGGRAIPSVLQFNCTKADLPFAFEINGQMHYRGRIIEPVSKPKQRKLREIQLDIEGKL